MFTWFASCNQHFDKQPFNATMNRTPKGPNHLYSTCKSINKLYMYSMSKNTVWEKLTQTNKPVKIISGQKLTIRNSSVTYRVQYIVYKGLMNAPCWFSVFICNMFELKKSYNTYRAVPKRQRNSPCLSHFSSSKINLLPTQNTFRQNIKLTHVYIKPTLARSPCWSKHQGPKYELTNRKLKKKKNGTREKKWSED